MSDAKISELPASSGATPASDVVPIVHLGTTEKITTQALVNSGLLSPGPIGFTPTGTIASTTVQGAIAEITTDLSASTGSTLIGHTPAGNIAATTVATAINELDTEKTAVSALSASTGSTLIGHISSGTGSVARTVQAKLRDTVSVKDFGAVGDGVTDDTAAIQAAINTGEDIFIPASSSYYKLTSELLMQSNQRVYGEGNSSLLRQTTTLLNVISATSKANCLVENIGIYAVGDRGSYLQGSGIFFNACSYSMVRGVTVQNHRGAGVLLCNTNDSEVSNNIFVNSPVQDLDLDTITFCDIGVVYSSSRNKVFGNNCKSGQATGIQIQSVAGGDTANDNVVIGNSIYNAKAYGIIAYRNAQSLPVTQYVLRNIISDNVIDGVAGTIENSVSSTYTYGAGIYLQGAEDSTVSGNTITNTHSGAVTFHELLAPGAIGATNASRYTIQGNTIATAGMFGIDIGDPNGYGDALGGAIVSSNVITSCIKCGINVREKSNNNINGNTIDTTGSSGIRVNNSSLSANNNISNNTVLNTTGIANIELNYCHGVISNNVLNGSSIHGIYAANCTDISITGNNIKNHTIRGIQVASTTSGASVTGNTVIGAAGSTVGMQLDALTSVDDSNRVLGNTTNWSGNYAVLRGTQTGVAVGNVGTGEDDLITYTLPASSMVTTNDSVSVVAWGTSANNANAKTLKMYFGSQLVLTTSLTVSQAGTWRVEANFVRTGASAQRAVAQLNQGGTTSIIDVETTSCAVTETAAIIIKCTGEATADNDIAQQGMSVKFIKG